MTHIVGSISWNSNNWTASLTDENRRWSSFGNIRAGYFGNESWNFTLSKYVRDRYKYGSFENAHRARRFVNGRDIIFFFSRGPHGGLFVGLYAKAELLTERVQFAEGGPEFNLKVPTEPDYLICPFEYHLLADPKRHFREGSQVKKGPGQICFCYIDHGSANLIVNDALMGGNSNVAPVKEIFGF